MKKFINHIRKQPEHVRRHILHVVVICFGVILVSIWVYSLSSNLTNADTQAKIKQDFQPLTNLQNNNASIPSSW